MRPQSQLLSIGLHAVAVAVILLLPYGRFSPATPDETRARPTPARIAWPQRLPASASGGGQHELRPATKGALVQVIRPVFIPPTVQRVEQPRLILDSGVDTAVPRIDLPMLGDPLASAAGGPPSAGPGQGPGVGNRGRGPYGDGDGNGPPGGGLARILGATPPVLLHKVEPDYSDEARKSHFQGTVLLAVDVDEHGQVTNVRVLRPLGLGLDEKAVEAVQRWRFKPASKDGRAIAYPAAIEVRFQLL